MKKKPQPKEVTKETSIGIVVEKAAEVGQREFYSKISSLTLQMTPDKAIVFEPRRLNKDGISLEFGGKYITSDQAEIEYLEEVIASGDPHVRVNSMVVDREIFWK